MIHIPEQRKEVPLQTVRGLMVVLEELVRQGHGETSIFRADVEAGPCGISSLELYDTEKEKQRGELPSRLTFLIC